MNLNEEVKHTVAENEEPEQDDPQVAGDDLGFTGASIGEDDIATLLEREQMRVDELTDQLQRERADLINYRRRKEQEQDGIRTRAIEDTLRKLLPVLDDFHRAVKSLPSESAGDSWAEGFRLIENNLLRALESEGVKPMESVGHPFDPARHEAVMFDENTDGEYMVVEEFQRGYLIDDRVLRPAMVKVGSIDTEQPDNSFGSNGNRQR